MYRKLQQNRKQDVEVEDVAERTFPRELLNRLRGQLWPRYGQYSTAHLGTRDAQEADAHHHPGDRYLIISKLDPVEVLDRERVGCDEAVEREDLVHLDSGDEGAATLTDDVGD
jgi:hypothetical protein